MAKSGKSAQRYSPGALWKLCIRHWMPTGATEPLVVSASLEKGNNQGTWAMCALCQGRVELPNGAKLTSHELHLGPNEPLAKALFKVISNGMKGEVTNTEGEQALAAAEKSHG